MTRARALQLCPNDHPPFLDLCRNHAAALERAGMVVDTVFFGAPRGERWEDATYLGIERGTRQMTARLREFAAGRGYGLVIAHRYRAHQVVTRARDIFADATFVTVAHEFGMFARWRRRWRRRLFANGVLYAGVSQAVADEMLRYGVPRQQTLVLPNPIDVARFDAAVLPREAARERLGASADARLIGVVGRLHPKKRPQLALEGFAGLGDEFQLMFVGDGAQRGSLEALAAQLGVAERIHFAGNVTDASRYAAAFDAVIVASTREEAFGMALLEAMLARVPAICADVPGPRSVLGPGGVYFCDAASLTAALSRVAALAPSELAALSEVQRSRAVELFSVEAVAARYGALLSRDAVRLPDAS
jgi:glycosyltransferase involved in cell wall biosynthesis